MRPRPSLARTLLILLALAATPLTAGLQPVSLDSRIDDAAWIVEATVGGSVSFVDPTDGSIRTEHRLHLTKVFKSPEGAVDPDPFVLVTPGGRVGDRLAVVVPSLDLRSGESGMFFAVPGGVDANGVPAFRPLAGPQALVRYRGRGAYDPFLRFADRVADLFAPIESRLDRPHREVSGSQNGASDLAPDEPGDPAAPASHSISSVSPSVVRGGVQDVLTIDGTGFGTFTGSATVFFDNPNDGPGGNYGSVDPEHIVSWTDTRIEVRVPARVNGTIAGSGRIIVRDAAGTDAFSPDSVTVEYSINEINSGGLYRMNLQDQDGRGGYVFRYSTATADNGVDFTSTPGAMARFEDAIAEWNCASDWNAQAIGTTSIRSTGDDGVNIVAWDHDADPLPGGVLGRATSYFRSCGGDTWHLTGADLRFRRGGSGIDWYFGADPAGQAGTESDFMSVALHELGHAVQHGHINDIDDTMYYSIFTGTSNRDLTTANADGGREIVGHSAAFAACDSTGMVAFDCLAAPTVDFGGAPLGTCGTSLSVAFEDLSTNGPTSWNWTFGDTGASTERSPTHFYASQGLYSVSLQASNANGADQLSRSDYIVVTDPPAAAACAPTFSGHNDCCDLGILNVTLNSIDRSTSTVSDGDPMHEDFSCSDFTVLEAGSTHAISVKTGNYNDERVRVYVDWNSDGSLDESELAFSSGPGRTHEGSVVVPAGAVTGSALRMRVMSDFASFASACDNLEYGQVEDYSVVVESASVGSAPGSIPDTSMIVKKSATEPGKFDFFWSPACGSGAVDYSIHEGEYLNWYSHTAVVCSTGGATSYYGYTPQPGSRYYLVVPMSASAEGSYGSDSSDAERPVSASTCFVSQDVTSCP